MAQLPIKQAVPRFQENEDRVNIFVNAPTGEDYYTTSEGENVKTLPKLVIDAEQAIQYVIDSGIGTGVIHHQMITTDGVSSTYPLTFDPIHSGNIIVNDNGIVQKQDSYSVVGTDLVLNYVPSAGVNRIEVLVFDTVPLGETHASQVSYTNSDGSVTSVEEAITEGISSVSDNAVLAGVEANRAEQAASDAETAAAASLASSKVYVDTTAGLAATTNGQVFLVKTSDPQVYNVYTNSSGTAVASGTLNIADGALIGKETSKNLFVLKSNNGDIVAVITKTGDVYLPGFSSPLKTYIDRFANTVIGPSNQGLVEVHDVEGKSFGYVNEDGKYFLPGMVGDVASSIRAIAGRTRVLSEKIEAAGKASSRQTFYSARPSGNIVEYNISVKDVTATSTRKTKSWPQGKLDKNSLGHVMLGHNEASSHGNVDTRFYTQRSEDGGFTWTPPEMVVDGQPGKAADCFAYGVDNTDREWIIIRNRGNNNAVGTTSHELFIRDNGVLTSYGELSEIVQSGFVPELFHDFEFVNGRMMSFYHFAASSRVGIISIDVTNPASRLYVDVIPHASGTFPPTTLVEGTLCWDQAAGKIIGGLRTQSLSYSPRWFYINQDLTGFTMFNVPEVVQYNPYSLAIVGGNVYTLSVERFNNGVMNLWTIPLSDFYASNTSNAFKIQIGKIIDTPLTGSSETGVPHFVSIGNVIHFAFAMEKPDGYSSVFYSNFNPVIPDSWITYPKLAGGYYD